jgi:hypothetical protein
MSKIENRSNNESRIPRCPSELIDNQLRNIEPPIEPVISFYNKRIADVGKVFNCLEVTTDLPMVGLAVSVSTR